MNHHSMLITRRRRRRRRRQEVFLVCLLLSCLRSVSSFGRDYCTPLTKNSNRRRSQYRYRALIITTTRQSSSSREDVRSSSGGGSIPIDPSGWPDKFPAKEHCSKCGLCETSFVSQVKEACAFLGEGMARMDAMEEKVHGRRRALDSMVWSTSSSLSSSEQKDQSQTGEAEEARFGVLHQPVMLAKGLNIAGAQWTGCVTGIALSMLESGMVDAVVCIANDDSDGTSWSSSEPIVAKTSTEVLRGRGVKPALAPSLRVLDDIQKDDSIRKLLFCGVGCAVQGKFTRKVKTGLWTKVCTRMYAT